MQRSAVPTEQPDDSVLLLGIHVEPAGIAQAADELDSASPGTRRLRAGNGRAMAPRPGLDALGVGGRLGKRGGRLLFPAVLLGGHQRLGP